MSHLKKVDQADKGVLGGYEPGILDLRKVYNYEYTVYSYDTCELGNNTKCVLQEKGV